MLILGSRIALAAALVHAVSLAFLGRALLLPGALLVEALAFGSLAVFAITRNSQRCERQIASRSIFFSSLVLALAAPAALLPAAAARAEAWSVGPGGEAVVTSAWPFALWSLSFLFGGLAMHRLTNERGMRKLAR